jgi:hypothetical protein
VFYALVFSVKVLGYMIYGLGFRVNNKIIVVHGIWLCDYVSSFRVSDL